MPGTLIIKGTIYAWNISNIGDQICLERFSMLFIGKRSGHIWSPMLLMFQAYIVLFIISVPGISGPQRGHAGTKLFPNTPPRIKRNFTGSSTGCKPESSMSKGGYETSGLPWLYSCFPFNSWFLFLTVKQSQTKMRAF